MIRAIFFDFGGVLTETCWDLNSISEAIKRGFKEAGVGLPNNFDNAFMRRMEERWRVVLETKREERLIDILKKLLDELGVNYSANALDLAMNYVMDAPFCIIRKEAKKVLSELKRMNLKLGIISNSPIAFHKRVLKRNNLLDFFDDIIISCEVGYRKPDKTIFNIALKRLNVMPNEAIYVGDIPCIDVPGARELGMITILMKYGDPAVLIDYTKVQNNEELCKADYVIDNLEEIINIVREISRL